MFLSRISHALWLPSCSSCRVTDGHAPYWMSTEQVKPHKKCAPHHFCVSSSSLPVVPSATYLPLRDAVVGVRSIFLVTHCFQPRCGWGYKASKHECRIEVIVHGLLLWAARDLLLTRRWSPRTSAGVPHRLCGSAGGAALTEARRVGALRLVIHAVLGPITYPKP